VWPPATTCEFCHDGFHLDAESGNCVVNYDDTMVRVVVYCIAALVVVLVLLAILWTCIFKAHPRAREHMMHLRRARRHRHLAKAAQWNLHSKVQVRRWWTLGENMHTADIAGVGLPLLFNTLVFVVALSSVFMFGLWFAFYGQGFAETYNYVASHHGNSTTAADAVQILGRDPVVVTSRLRQCHTLWWNMDDVRSMADRMFSTTLSLYAFAFLASLWFGRYQKRYAEWFDRVTPSMSDYAIRVRDLPPDETDEPKLREVFQAMFREAVPDKIERPDHVEFASADQVEDTVTPQEPGQIEVEAVSIAYEFMERRQEVDDTLWKMMEVFEVDLYSKAKDVPRNQPGYEKLYEGHDLTIDNTSLFDPADPATHGMTVSAAHAKVKEQAAKLFEGDNRLKGTGVAYVVFKYIRDKEAVERYIEKDPQAFQLGGVQLRLEPVFTEPTGIVWWSHGISSQKLRKNVGMTLLKIFMLIFVLEVCIVYPYWYFIRKPFQDVGTTATGFINTLYGIIVGNLNGLVYCNIYGFSEGIGFPLKDDLFSFATFGTILFTFAMLIINIGLDARVVVTNYGSGPLSLSVGMSTHMAAVMPSMMFAGRPMNIIMPTIQYVWNQALAKVLYVWKCLPDCILRVLVKILPYSPGSIDHWPFRNAEKLASPWQMPITGDFADIVVIPTLCFVMLIFISTSCWFFFALLCGWGLYIYVYVRYAYLRFHGLDFITTSTLFSVAWYLWGIPISVVAANVPHWFYVKDDIHEDASTRWSVMGVAFVASFALWSGCYHFFVRPFKETDATEQDASLTVAEAKMHRVYDWLNCNPVFALKCRYYFQDVGGEDQGLLRGHPLACGENPAAVRFYEIGKEYLFLRVQRQYMIEYHLSNFLEPDYWTDIGSSGVARMMAPLLAHLVPVKTKLKSAYEQVDLAYRRGVGNEGDSSAPLIP